MKLLLKNAQIVNVFTDRLEEANILIDGEKIIGVGQYKEMLIRSETFRAK